jgi:hypothetical protein
VLCRCQGRIADAAIERVADRFGDDVFDVRDQLCRGAGSADAGAIGCSREAPMLGADADDAPIRFFPAREYAAGGAAAAPRLAALIAMARLPDPPPVDAVSYGSAGLGAASARQG